MKIYSKIILLVFFALVSTNCEDSYPVFDGESFGQTLVSFVGSTSIQPVIVEGTAVTEIEVQISTPSDSDRTIQVQAAPTSTATTNQYTISDLTIPAGSYSGTISVKGVYANIPQGTNFILDLVLLGTGGSNEVIGNGTYRITLFRFCPVQIGTYRIEMADSYGDGWQTTTGLGGAGMRATFINASGAQTSVEFGMCSAYAGSTFLQAGACTANAGLTATTNVVVPAGTVDIIWNFPGDRYGEISFKIFAPNGNQIYNSGAPGAQAAGNLPPLIYCR